MLKQLRQTIINTLWNNYRKTSMQINAIETQLMLRGVKQLTLDHLAIIDLPGPHTGISQLSQLFAAIGYTPRGRDYLPEKQNDFLWMAESDSAELLARDALPQVVVADFRLHEMPPEIRSIIEKYGQQALPAPLNDIQTLLTRVDHDENALNTLTSLITGYLSGRDWPLPTVNEFRLVQEFNELLAWVLIFGRRPNHFTLSVHLMKHFASLNDFLHFIEHDMQLSLNQDGGIIKGSLASGIEQSSTVGIVQKIHLRDGEIELPTEFIEFVWRYPHNPAKQHPERWDDYFTGFVANHANRVIESLYGF